MQTFSLHETTRGRSYQPPRWAEVMAQIHKKQTSQTPPPRPAGPGPAARLPEGAPRPSGGPVRTEADAARAEGEGARSGAARAGAETAQAGAARAAENSAGKPLTAPAPEAARTASKRHPLPLKIFFLIVSVGLLLSTLTGVYMAYKYNRNPAVITSLLVAGALIPIALIFV
jgi:hypothetical protein